MIVCIIVLLSLFIADNSFFNPTLQFDIFWRMSKEVLAKANECPNAQIKRTRNTLQETNATQARFVCGAGRGKILLKPENPKTVGPKTF